MGRRNRCKPRMIPRQDRRICGCICFCQLVVVFSCVSLIYLTVAIYIPSYRAFRSGFDEQPIMCQTINTSMLNNCSWASCGEWCLTKTSGFCPQIHATARQNGTRVQLQNCTSFHTSYCPPIDTDELKKHNCNNGTECSSLKGVFNCSRGHCLNISQIYDCHYKADGFTVDSDKDNAKLNGFFECKGSKCTKIKRVLTSCNRICKENITSASKNVFLVSGNHVHQAYCESANASTLANGNRDGTEIEPTQFWKRTDDDIFMVSCHTVFYDIDHQYINATDCVNGTLYNVTSIPQPYMNFRQFWNLSGKWREFLDPTNKFVPIQSNLTIYNNSRLYINLDGCVNTLKGECLEFLHTHGADGRNQTAQSRYPCFHNKNSSFMVIARYDLKRTWRDLIIAISIPSVLFVVSFITLCIIMQSVRVDDDTKMRCKYCFITNDTSDLTEMLDANNKYEVSSPESDGPSNRSRRDNNLNMGVNKY